MDEIQHNTKYTKLKSTINSHGKHTKASSPRHRTDENFSLKDRERSHRNRRLETGRDRTVVKGWRKIIEIPNQLANVFFH